MMRSGASGIVFSPVVAEMKLAQTRSSDRARHARRDYGALVARSSIYRQAGPEAAQGIIDQANDKDEDSRIRLMARFHIIERAYGKAKDHVGDDRPKYDFSNLSPTQLVLLQQAAKLVEAAMAQSDVPDAEVVVDGGGTAKG